MSRRKRSSDTIKPASQSPGGALAIEVAWRPRKSWNAVSLLRRVAAHVANAEGFHKGSLSVVVVGQRAMRTLHRRFMDDDSPTDVLTFDLGSDPASGLLEAEIIICTDVARRRSPSLAAARRELALYLTHGILHLAGYDDHDQVDFDRMHAREDELLAALGVGPVFRTNH